MKKFAFSKVFFACLFIILGLFISQLITNHLVFGSEVVGNSMLPTFNDGQKVWVNRLAEPKRGDIVIVDEGDKYVIKRLLGLPGDVIHITKDALYINNKVYEEDYVISNTHRSGLASSPLELGEDDYFILGDNRDISRDSRDIGAINRDKIVGVVIIYDLNVERVQTE